MVHVKGDHQVVCAGFGSRTWSHYTIRDLIAQDLTSTGYDVKFEQNGGSGLNDRPGNIQSEVEWTQTLDS